MKYFRDVDTGFIVRSKDDSLRLEYTYDDFAEWKQTKPGSPYEREHWLGQGNTCLFDITEKEAIDIISSRNSLNEDQVRAALQCFLFGTDKIYIQVDENGPLFVCNLGSKSWSRRDSLSFWESYDLDPYVFLPISNDEAVKMIFCS